MSAALLVSLVLTGSAAVPSREASLLEEVLVAAFRHQIAEVFAARSAQFAADPIICVGTTVGAGDRDPEEPIMKRLAVDPSVRPVSLCVVDEGLAREKSSGREAVILKSGSVEWLSDDEAHVEMSYYRSKLSSMTLTLRVVKEPHGWIALGPTWKQSFLPIVARTRS